ncbi:MAG: ShlB/FhaC/HecB family hemolysin secretion/activation protein [Micavibrio aeruginosavorus]|nr:ShlB/FhaC/HecB family hemolysin secretion/activation protein [Micavibrio aeruginosavorus]
MSARCKNRAIGLLYATALIVVPSFAVQAQDIPPSAEPGIVTRSIEEERRAPSRFEGAVTLGAEEAVEGLSAEKVFTLQSVVLDGGSVYDQKAIDAVAADYIGQMVSFADLNAIGQRLTRKYRDDGYVFSRVILPPQTIKDGIVHLQAIEGRVTDVNIVGEYKDNNNLIADLAAKIKSEGPANTKDLERYLLLIDDLPGITARSLMQPSKTPGGGDLTITIEQDTFEGSAAFDNRGSKYLGRYRGTLIGAINSLFGIHDRTTLRGIATTDLEELRFADLTHEEQIGTEGMRVKGRVAVTDTEPGRELEDLDVQGDSRLLDLEFLYPVLRSRQYNLNLTGGFTALNSESDILGLEVANDRVRFIHAGGSFDFTDAWAGVTQIDLQVAQGLDVFNATDDGTGRSRANGEHDFLRTNLSATRIQDLWGDFSMQISAAGQYSDDALLASEEFTVGGETFGRGYDVGEIAGDRGIAGAVELRYGGPTTHDLLRSYQVYTYYDAGKVWNDDPSVDESSHDSLASAGVGVRFNLNYGIFGYVELNTPLTRDVSAEGDDDSRLFFNVLKRF